LSGDRGLFDMRYVFRGLVRAPVFTVIAILTLALGIASATAFFTVVNGVLLRPLPYKNSNRLVFTVGAVLAADFRDIKAENHVFDQMALFESSKSLLADAGEAQSVESMVVSPDVLPMLGVVPAFGRSFEPGEYHPGRDSVVLLSHRIWVQRFRSEPGILGKSIVLNSQPYTVVGILPAWFHYKFVWYENDADVWLPLALNSAQLEQRGTPKLTSNGPAPDHYATALIAELKQGVTLRRAQENYSSIVASLISRYPNDQALRGRRLYSLKYLQVGSTGDVLWPLLGGAGLLLLISCVNVSGLMLARGLDRRREMAIRVVLGARRSQVVRYFLEESLLLSLAGAAFGLPLSVWAISLFRSLAPPGYVPRLEQAGVDGWVLLFTLVVALLAAIFSGLFSGVVCSRSGLNSGLKGTSDSRLGLRSRARFSAQKWLLVAQIGAAMVLLIGASLMGRSLWLMITEDLGFDPQHVIQGSIQRVTSLANVQNWDTTRNFAVFQELLKQVKTVPTVKSAALAGPPVGGASGLPFYISGQNRPRSEDMPLAYFWSVTPEFFKTLNVPLIRGRYFTAEDAPGLQPTVIVNRMMARTYFPGSDAIGHYLTYTWRNKDINARVVGEIADAKMAGLDQPAAPQIYLCFWQTPLPSAVLYVRTDADAASLTPVLQDKVQRTSKDLALLDVKPVAEVLSESSVADPRFLTSLLGTFAVLALILTVVGVFGAAALNVRRRTHEIGIRVALGAQNKDVLRTVLFDSVAMSFIGVVVGALAALALTRLIRTWLYGVAPADPATFILSGILLLGICLVASYIPSRRALHVDPAIVLRAE